MPAAADHEVIVQRDADGFDRFADGAGHVDIRFRGRDIARGMVVDQYTQRSVSIIFQPLAEITKSTGVVNWYMWCVTGRDKQPMVMHELRRYSKVTPDHGSRIMNLVMSHRVGLEQRAVTIRLNRPRHIPPAAKTGRVCKSPEWICPNDRVR
jgi:hypothetical protein